MTFPRVTDERIAEIAAFHAQNGRSRLKTGEHFGLSRGEVDSALRIAAKRGLSGFDPVLDGFEVAETKTTFDKHGEITSTSVTQRPEAGPEFEIPQGMAFAGGKYHVGPDGRVKQHWPYVKPPPASPADIAAEIKAGLLDLRGKAPYIAIPPVANEDLLAAFYFADAHLGQRSWHEEVGVNYDLGIAEEQICGAYDEAIARAPRCDTALIAILGDYTHADDETAQTPASKHILDVDGRFGKTRRVASRILRYKIDRARERFRNVLFRYIPGNHDPKSAGWLSHGISMLYEDVPNVTIDDRQDKFGWYEHGLTMLGLFHGDRVRPRQFRDIAVTSQAAMWGRTLYRYGHAGHIHKAQTFVDECGGMIVKTHQAITAQDTYAHDNFPLSLRGVDVEVYSRRTGLYLGYPVTIENREAA